MGDSDDLRLGLDRAWTGHEHYFPAPDPRAVLQLDDGRLPTPFPGHLLVRLGDVDHPQDPRQRLQAPALHLAVVAEQADRRTLLAGKGTSLVAHLPDGVDDAIDVAFFRAVLHYDEHDRPASCKR